MDKDTWATHYKRLTTAYNKPINAEQAGIFFTALESLPGGIVGLAVDEHIKNRPAFPHASDLREKAASLLASKTTYEAPECPRCAGNTWIDDEPREKWDRSYATVRRCTVCWTLGTGHAA